MLTKASFEDTPELLKRNEQGEFTSKMNGGSAWVVNREGTVHALSENKNKELVLTEINQRTAPRDYWGLVGFFVHNNPVDMIYYKHPDGREFVQPAFLHDEYAEEWR